MYSERVLNQCSMNFAVISNMKKYQILKWHIFGARIKLKWPISYSLYDIGYIKFIIIHFNIKNMCFVELVTLGHAKIMSGRQIWVFKYGLWIQGCISSSRISRGRSDWHNNHQCDTISHNSDTTVMDWKGNEVSPIRYGSYLWYNTPFLT